MCHLSGLQVCNCLGGIRLTSSERQNPFWNKSPVAGQIRRDNAQLYLQQAIKNWLGILQQTMPGHKTHSNQAKDGERTATVTKICHTLRQAVARQQHRNTRRFARLLSRGLKNSPNKPGYLSMSSSTISHQQP